MKREDRIKLISGITNNNVWGPGRRLRYQGETKDFKIFDIPLSVLIYNIDNGRIGSLVKSHTKHQGQVDPESDSGTNLIAHFLYESNEIANKRTLEDIAQSGQLEPGIITADGIIVDGNRRASLMRRILADPNSSPDAKARCENFRTVVLPENASQKDILRLETIYQLGSDEKVGYNAIEKYLHARDMEDRGFSVGEIEEYMGAKAGAVQELLEVAELFDEYLDHCDCTGLYTRLPKGCEDDFLKLNTAIRKVQSGRISWIPNDRLEDVEVTLKAICFNYIRLNMKSEDGFDFRAILQTSGGNFLQSEKIWESFSDQCLSVVENIEEKNIDDLIDSDDAEGKTLSRLLNVRDAEWREKVKEGLKDAFKNAKDSIENQREKERPLSLLKKAYNALNGVDLELLYRSNEKRAIEGMMEQIKNIYNDIENALNSGK